MVDRRLVGILLMVLISSTSLSIAFLVRSPHEKIKLVKNYWETVTLEGWKQLPRIERPISYTLGLVARRRIGEVVARFGILRNQTLSANYTGWDKLTLRERAIRIGGLEFLDSRAADVERSMGVGPVETWTEVTIAGRQVRLFILDYDPLIAPLADRRVAMESPSLFAFVLDSTGNVTQFYSGCWDFFVDRSRSILELTIQLNENVTTYANKQHMVEGSDPLAETIPWAGEVVFKDLCKDDRVFITFRVNGGAVSGDQSVMQIVELRVDGEYLGPIVNILKR